jgi:hypothetical protein
MLCHKLASIGCKPYAQQHPAQPLQHDTALVLCSAWQAYTIVQGLCCANAAAASSSGSGVTAFSFALCFMFSKLVASMMFDIH